MTSVRPLSEEIVKNLNDYDYQTFLIGASVPHTILDNDDELRSRFKIKGRDSVKSQITKMLSQAVKLETGKEINYSKPDLTVLASLTDKQISVNVRSLWLSGKYVKLKRGLPQRSLTCEICNGLGCAGCGYRGSSPDSIQARITNFLASTFGGETCNFVWMGSEDENSLVRTPGRPFYVEVVKPRKRFAMKDRLAQKKTKVPFFRSKEILIRDLELLDKKVTEIPTFEIQAKVFLRKKPESPPLETGQIRAMESKFTKAGVSVRLSRKFRTVQKEIHWIRVKAKDAGESVEVKVSCDGGVPLKKLISGQDDTVSPNLGQYLGSYEIDRARPFDVLRVTIKAGSGVNSKDVSGRVSALAVPELEE